MKSSLPKFHLLCKCQVSVKMSLTQNTISEILNFIEFSSGRNQVPQNGCCNSSSSSLKLFSDV